MESNDSPEIPDRGETSDIPSRRLSSLGDIIWTKYGHTHRVNPVSLPFNFVTQGAGGGGGSKRTARKKEEHS